MKHNYRLLFIWSQFLLIALPNAGWSQENKFFKAREIPFDLISVNEGLSQSYVHDIIQDYRGFMWIATLEGLNRYDGYNFEVFKHIDGDPESISGNNILCLLETRDHFIWAGTSNGDLNRFDRKTNTFKSYPIDQEKAAQLEVNTLFEHSNGDLWIGTSNGLYVLDHSTETIREHTFSDHEDAATRDVESIFEDDSGNLYVGVRYQFGGLFYLDLINEVNYHFTVDQSLRKYQYSIGAEEILRAHNEELLIATQKGVFIFNEGLWQQDLMPKQEVKTEGSFHKYCSKYNTKINNSIAIAEDQRGKLWVGGFMRTGLKVYDPEISDSYPVDFQVKLQEKFNALTVISIYISSNEEVWLGTNGGGLFKYSALANKFSPIRPNDPDFLFRSKSVRSIFVDSNERIWVGGYGGLDVIYSKQQVSRHVGLAGVGNPVAIKGSPVWNILEMPEMSGDVFMIATEGEGVYLYDYARNQVTENFYPGQNKQNPKNYQQREIFADQVFILHRDELGTIWAGTDLGLEKYNAETNNFEPVILTKSFCNTQEVYISDILSTNSLPGYLWLATKSCGLFLFDKSNKKLVNFTHLEGDGASISGNVANTLYEDSKGKLWVGTSSGASFVDQSSVNQNSEQTIGQLTFSSITELDGLANNIINGILEDDQGSMWFSTNKGLSKLLPDGITIINYDILDGIQDLEFNTKAHFKDINGVLYFGGKNGLNKFNPQHIKSNPHPPQIVFTGFKVLNEPYQLIQHGDRIDINEASEITLKHKQNFITFEFAALDYNQTSKNQYAYRLEGFNDQWIEIGSKREATYTNLDPGTYSFVVIASNSDGIWSETGKAIQLVIEPPWWKTLPAIVLWALIAIVFMVTANRLLVNRARMQEQLKLEIVENKHLKELNEAKSNFFANISHEFRTPLTLILNPVKILLSRAQSSEDVNDLNMVQKNALKLLQMINQILDLSKLESNQLEKQTETGDLVGFIRYLASSFDSLADLKGIAYQKHFEIAHLYTDFSKKHLEHIVNNLLSNAMKFTPKNGKVSVAIQLVEQQKILISVKDTGIGIPKEDIEHVFDRFYQVNSNNQNHYEGTGIGLSLVKELVDLHNGEITIKSELNWGTEVNVYFTLSRVYEQSDVDTRHTTSDSEISVTINGDEDTQNIKQPDKEHTVLIVEDNQDLQNHVNQLLNHQFNTLTAADGVQGIEIATQHIPDVIVSDVMMPNMGGLEMTQHLKKKMATSHIPILLLTAKSEQVDKIEGLKVGADQYLPKPFDAEELVARITNMILNRKRLQDKFKSVRTIKPSAIKAQSLEEQFLQKAIAIVERFIGDETFSVDTLSKEIGMSRVQFHRKIKALTNQPTTHFIRTIRLERAKDLLEQEAGNITDIAYKVGFSSQSYFTRCFQEHFGHPPSEDLKKSV